MSQVVLGDRPMNYSRLVVTIVAVLLAGNILDMVHTSTEWKRW
jgi:hypothetical protein